MKLFLDTRPARNDQHHLTLKTWALFAVWSLLSAMLLTWALRSVDEEMLGLARQEARANFNKDQVFRVWATGHGGVYVPVTERTQPSPYLAHIPERDVITPSGRHLTLLNPAHILRQMMEDFDELYGVKGKITSLHPLNPGNAADAWETAALGVFAAGGDEVFEITEIAGHPFLRLMRPMVTRAGCLKCHDPQRFQVGAIQGGVGISVPLDTYYAVAQGRKRNLWAILSTIWLLGTAGIWYWARRDRQRIVERLSYQARIWRQANFDPLTNLSNRNLFHDRLEQALGHAQRENHQLALLFIDLDHFKDINDTRGHDIGDQLLQQVAKRLKASVRESDTVSRLGGDEFTVILADMVEGMSANLIARNILQALTQPFAIAGQDAHLSASIGITVYPQDGATPTALLKNADTAMYQAKNSGRNAFRYFTSEMNRLAEERVWLENALRRALDRQEFSLHYQPIIDIATRRLIGAEALIRWQCPGHGTIMPDRFIGAAEACGLILPLGDWILQQAADDMATWDKAGLILERVSVNVSSMQFKAQAFPTTLERLRQNNPHIHDRLCLEITESVFLDGGNELIDQLKSLPAQGIHLSIDDFGTGYSSLGYLKRFPVDNIKIDRSFVRDVITDPEDAALCEAILAMAHHLGLQVVAEGVENNEQLAFLERNGCDKAQGYYFSPPLAPVDFAGLLQRAATKEI